MSDRVAAQDSKSLLGRGQRIIFQWDGKTGPEYPGKIISIHNDGTYTIELDRHSMLLVVPKPYVRAHNDVA